MFEVNIIAAPLAWDTGKNGSLVNIGTHSLALYSSGPDRKSGEPVVLIMPGLASSITGWAAVCHLLKAFIRVVAYDRTGYGNSDCSDEEPTSGVIASELDALLKAAGIAGPYVLVVHSWGGVLVREFLELRGKDVVGCLFVDANQEDTIDVLDWRLIAMNSVLQGVDGIKATGREEKSKLTKEEWKLFCETEASEKHQRQAGREFAIYPESFTSLKKKKQMDGVPPFMGTKPVYVLKGDNRVDLQAMLDVGISMGNGTEEERTWCQKFLASWDEKDRELQRGILRLSNVGQFAEVEGAGHHVHITQPESIVKGVRWVLKHVKQVR